MVGELCLMASHGYPPGLGVFLHQEQGFSRVSKDLHHFLPYHSSNQDLVNSHPLNLHLQQKEEWKSIGGQLMGSHHLLATDSNSTRSALFDVQDNHPNSLLFSFGIAEQYTRQEQILNLLASGLIDADGSVLDLSMLYDLMGPQQPIRDLPQQPFASYPRWCFDDAESQQSLIYPTRELYLNEPSFELTGDMGCCTENMYGPDCQLQLQCNCIGNEMSDILSVISEFHLSKNTVKSSKQTMLVPYFERRKRVRSNTNSLKLATEKVAPLKSNGKVKEKTSSQKRKASTRTGKKSDVYCNSYLHACESLLSIIVNRKQQGNSTILSVKKSGLQLPQLLTQFSATVAGTGIAVVLSVACRVACCRVPFCGSKVLSTGLGLGLVWLSWAVNRLRDTVISIGKSSGKPGAREEEMMNHLDRNLKDIYFRAAAIMVVAVLRLA